MSLANSSGKTLSRFTILELLSKSFFGLTCQGLAERAGQEQWNTRSGRASLATRLRRLRSFGLVYRELDGLSRPARSRREGVYRWRISERGRCRLKWARDNELV